MYNMFVQPAFIRKNTPELRKRLEELGYHNNLTSTEDGTIIITFYNGYYNTTYNVNDYIKNVRINCGTNEHLFLAIAALRHDNDYMQWFTNGKHWIRCTTKYIDPTFISNTFDLNYHKATVSELIRHFKLK